MKVMKSTATNDKKVRAPHRLRLKTMSTLLSVGVIVAVILLNIIVSTLADRYPITFDLSSDKVFTLSQQSKDVAKATTKEVEIIVFADVEEYYLNQATTLYQVYLAYYGQEVNMANQFERLGREVKTALAQLHTASDGKITYTFINPDLEPEKYAAYTKYNMGDNNVLFISGERHRKASLFNMFEMQNTQALTSLVEKVLVSNIYALQGENDRVVQVLTGHDEDTYTIKGLQTLYELNGYTFEELLITGSAEFNEQTEILLIPAPAKDYSEAEIDRVRTWLMNDQKRNRHLIVYINPTADCPNLYEMLKTEFCITVEDQLIYETSENRYSGYDPNQIFGDVSSTKYTGNSAGSNTVLTPLARRLTCTLPTSQESNELVQLGIPLITHPDTAKVSLINDSDKNVTIEDKEYPLTSAIAYVYETVHGTEADGITPIDATTTVMVCGSAAMAYTETVRNGTLNNEDFLLDTINTVTGYTVDITISDKVIAKDVTQFTTKEQLWLGIGFFTVGLPLAVLVVCLVIFLRRRRL